MGDKKKIDWCASTWNPVTGCLHGCEYCYARRQRTDSHQFLPHVRAADQEVKK